MEYWMVEKHTVDCPFCGKNIVTDYEQKYECEETDTPEVGEMIIAGDDCYRSLNSCDHMAYFSVACQDILEIDSGRVELLIDIARVINDNKEFDYDDEDLEECYEDLIAEYFDDINWDKVSLIIGKKYQKHEIAAESCYVDSGDGPNGGGPTYNAIFVNGSLQN